MSHLHDDADGPGPEDAQVVLKLYELRREEVMRASRDTLIRWTPKSYADLAAITQFDHEHNAAFRQVSSYFEMAYGLARRGAAHPELVVEWCGEGILLFAKIHPYLAEFREKASPTAFRNAEWVTENTEAGAARLKMFLDRFKTK
ncbi:hypothetical protein Poly30_56830 [Planctomycetes bacterium Poly30]|uniref:Uncharacterized protein n=1 Tax=Saltatorellus ferox TaxID=2528018 RepID=A0A518F1A0_9BACT|nr:hypothetical protein Poly30_56830 [Planctomycetes bacterium Poly30]